MLALQHMMQNNFSREDVSLMQNSLREEGWRSSELLPAGWLFNKGKHGTGIQIFSNQGEHFETCTAAKQSLASSSSTKEKDIRNIEKLVNDTMTQRNKIKLSNQSYLPKGWQSRMEGKGEVYYWRIKSRSSVSKFLKLSFRFSSALTAANVQI